MKKILLIGTICLIAVKLLAVSYPFYDDMENPAHPNWTEESPWEQITYDFHSDTTSYTDSPDGFYSNNIDVELKFSSVLNLTGATNPQLNFWHKYQIEPGFDFAYVEISTDGGTTFPTVLATYSGTSADPWTGSKGTPTKKESKRIIENQSKSAPWIREQIDLSTYSGESNVIIRFRLVTDNSIVWDGWYIDDVAIADRPTAVVLDTISNPTASTLDLNWSQNGDADFVRYEIYRSLSSAVSFNDVLVTTIYTQSDTSHTDTGLNQKTTYYYKVYVVNDDSIYAESNEESGTTTYNFDYPFYDDMESGSANWFVDTPGTWSLEDLDTLAHSPIYAWDDSPGDDYLNNINTSLSLTNDLTTDTLTQITYWYKIEILELDTAFVEYSTDSGNNWTELVHYTNTTASEWTRVQYDFGIASTQFRLRFRMKTNPAGIADGWYVDDVGISDLPDSVILSIPVPQPMPDYDKMNLSWTQSSDSYFKQYEIYRSTSAGVDSSGTPIATITNPVTTTYTDSGLTSQTDYYYKVYVVNQADAKKGSNEEMQTSTYFGGTVSYPFYDDMESGTGYWVYDGGFAQTTEDYYSANHSWTESPGGNYGPNADANLKITIDLSTADKPVLSFWHKYTTQSYADYVRVYISTDGSTWYNYFFKSGSGGIWEQEQIDLSEYVGNPEVTIRFRFTSDSSTQHDGWWIDDVRIGETTADAIPYPFYDNMDDTTSVNNWISSNWEINTGGHSSPNCWDDSPDGVYIDNINEQLILSNTIDLSSATHPLLSFWHKYQIENYPYSYGYQDYAYVQVSNDKGHSGTWTTIATYNGNQSSWTRVSFDISAFAGQPEVRVRFYLYEWNKYFAGGMWNTPQGWWIDDVRIEEAPVDVYLQAIANPTMHNADLKWTQNHDTDFYSYEIYRDTDSGVDRTSTLVATITTQADTTYTDIYSVLQPDHYYYRIYVKDSLGNYSPSGSNVQEAIYTVPQNSYPFSDDFESGSSKWEWGNPWGEDTTHYHSANTSWTDSPYSLYDNNIDASTDTYIDLDSAGTPVLSFWHKYSLEENADWGYVQITTDTGSTWTTLLSVTGTGGDWNEERIDLSTYAGENIGLRFRIVTNGSTTSDGWYIDDISVAEGNLKAPYPFSDDMESGIGYWTYDSPWNRVTSEYHSPDYSWTDSPSGSYPNDLDASLKLTIDLLSAVKPVITFWHYHTFETDADFGFLEISKDLGSSWSRRFFVTGNSLGWKKSDVDITEYAGYDNIMIRFRVVTNSSGQNDGWYIDDVTIDETTATISYPFIDTMDDTTSYDNWFSSNWELVSGGHSSPDCFHDSPYGHYPDNIYSGLTQANTMDLSSAVRPQLTFWHKYQIETYPYAGGYQDYAYIQISDNNGAEGTYTTLATYNGSQTNWTQVQIDLSDYAGLDSVRVRFLLYEWNKYSYSGIWVPPEGWWIDDVRIEDAPAAVTIYPAENVTMHNADLRWSMNHNSDFYKYEIYRDTDAVVDYNDELITTIYTQSDTTYTDIYTILQPDHYYYRIYVVDTLNTYCEGSNTISAEYSVPVNSYPFFDDFEPSKNDSLWDWNSPWGTTTDTSYSDSTCWTDSPVGDYANDYSGCLTTFIDLSSAVTPFLTYWQRFILEENADSGYVEVSTDNGSTWSIINTITGEEPNWNIERIDLTAYVGYTIGLRFRLTTNSSVVYDGWYIDDVSINEGTRVVSYPFYDDVESGVNAWHYTSPWGRTSTNSYSGSYSWTDSPQGSYRNNENTSLKIYIDFSPAVMPILSFYHYYSLQTNYDYGRVEISNNQGASWKMVYYVTGFSSGWKEEKIDLAEYAGDTSVWVRFRLTTSSSGQSDGWYIDDIRFDEPTVSISYPFVDNCDDSTSADYWLSSSFEQSAGGQDSLCWNENPVGVYIDNTNACLTLANTIDLSSAVSPQLTFWHKYQIENYYYSGGFQDYAYVQISNYKGHVGTYTTLATYNGNQTSWTQVTIDLTPYVGIQDARIRFYLYEWNKYSSDGVWVTPNGWWIDGIRIQESTTLNAVDWANLDSPASISMNAGDTTSAIYGKVYEPGITDTTGQGAGIIAELGYGADGSDPSSGGWTWVTANYDSDADSCDVYTATLTIGTGGTYDYCYRYRLATETEYIYADLDGNDGHTREIPPTR